eukprot:GILJ01023621.1.p1 GENE.GILJ01023621.1~~GILJ01023621.1.p1  ORF type:complete len:297 (+),score=38.61 GILJ01023621.1:854-1744(+)
MAAAGLFLNVFPVVTEASQSQIPLANGIVLRRFVTDNLSKEKESENYALAVAVDTLVKTSEDINHINIDSQTFLAYFEAARNIAFEMERRCLASDFRDALVHPATNLTRQYVRCAKTVRVMEKNFPEHIPADLQLDGSAVLKHCHQNSGHDITMFVKDALDPTRWIALLVESKLSEEGACTKLSLKHILEKASLVRTHWQPYCNTDVLPFGAPSVSVTSVDDCSKGPELLVSRVVLLFPSFRDVWQCGIKPEFDRKALPLDVLVLPKAALDEMIGPSFAVRLSARRTLIETQLAFR